MEAQRSGARPSAPNPSPPPPADLLHIEQRRQVTAYFIGSPPETEPGSPAPPLSFGVEHLEFAFAGDERRYRFQPEGELFFSDHSFDIFSPSGAYVALLQDHYGPYHLIATQRLKAYLSGQAGPDDVAGYAPSTTDSTLVDAGFSGVALVLGKLRWLSETEIEFEASGEATLIVRHELGGATRVVGRR